MAALLSLSAGLAAALGSSKAISQFGHDVWQDELPQNAIHCILQARNGYLWLGAYEGLIRFDGARFVLYDTRAPARLGGTAVLALAEDRNETLWIATNGGLSRYENGRFSTIGTAEALPNDSVRALAEDRDGTLWVGTRGGLARVSRDGRFRRLSTEDGLPVNLVRAIFVDRRGVVWVGTQGGGLAGWDGAGFRVLSRKEGLPHDDVRAIHEDRTGSLWVGTRGGLARLGALERGSPEVRTFSRRDGLVDDIVFSFLEEPDGWNRGQVCRLRFGSWWRRGSRPANGDAPPTENRGAWQAVEDRQGQSGGKEVSCWARSGRGLIPNAKETGVGPGRLLGFLSLSPAPRSGRRKRSARSAGDPSTPPPIPRSGWSGRLS